MSGFKGRYPDRLANLLLVTSLLVSFPGAAELPGEQASDALDGRWAGSVAIQGIELPFSVTFATGEDGLAATMDIPSQNAIGLDLTEVARDGDRVHFELDAAIGLATWDGALAGDVIEGEFTQGGASGTFRMERSAEESADVEPGEPPPYREEEVSFENGDVHLEGTLTVPGGPGPFPAVVMITGSGPQNRDEELVGFRPFRVIADHLTRDGIAVLRYDDRGVGGSTGNVALSTTEDFAGDVLAAVALLADRPDIRADEIGLIGHSEGGVVAPLAASRSDDIAFVVLLAGTSVPGSEIIFEQGALIARAQGADEQAIGDQTRFQRGLFAAVIAGEDLEPHRRVLERMIREGLEQLPPERSEAIDDVDAFVETRIRQQIGAVETPWFRYFLAHDPAVALRATSVPVLALFGERDLQVAPDQNRGPMEAALAHNGDVTIRILPGANHLFQEARTGSPTEYATLEKAFVPRFLELISNWIRERTTAA